MSHELTDSRKLAWAPADVESLPRCVELFMPVPPFYQDATVFSWWWQGSTEGVRARHFLLCALDAVRALRTLADRIEASIRPDAALTWEHPNGHSNGMSSEH